MILEQLKNLVGSRYLLTEETQKAAYLVEGRGDFESQADAVVLPANTDEVSGVVSFCAEHGISVVPQGGNTGLCGGAVARQGDIILNLSRMNKIIELDSIDNTITVEAGCILADIQQAALQADRYFPLSLGAEGSCQIGGNLATNAGGINVLRYGNVRDQVIGIEAVMPNGEIMNDLNQLRKNNTGYSLRHLFVGAEGTLGIITKATLAIYPRPHQVETAFVALRDLNASLDLLSMARNNSENLLSSFELIPRLGVNLAVRHIPGCKKPLPGDNPWCVLITYSGATSVTDLRSVMENTLASALAEGFILDAAISQNEQQALEMWKIREGLREAQTIECVAFSHDISVKVSNVPSLIERTSHQGKLLVPGVRPYPFGHIGDGNIHLSFLQPEEMTADKFQTYRAAFSEMVFETVDELDGSFSAEHGIGILRTTEMSRYKDPVSIYTMQAIKKALDPKGILNPGKVLPTTNDT
ncbi:MAG: hydroxyacid dehydrogenase [Acidiferrobacteraceae bacterium]|nr:hydroxyacid dehydrogenase [Acidiferrobacteraceae bacterium]